MESEGGDTEEAGVVDMEGAVVMVEAVDMEGVETAALEAEAMVALGMQDVATTPVAQAMVDFIPPLHQNDPLV